MLNNFYYCYSMPQKEFIESFGLRSIDDEALIHSLTKKPYYRFNRNDVLLDKALSKYKQNKIDAINYIKNINK